jgi:hypothetical protein
MTHYDTSRKVAGSIPDEIIRLNLQPNYSHTTDAASKRDEY